MHLSRFFIIVVWGRGKDFPRGSVVKNSPAMQKPKEMWVQSLGQDDPPEEEMATHSSIFAWRIPSTEKPGGLQSMGSQRVRCDWSEVRGRLVTLTEQKATQQMREVYSRAKNSVTSSQIPLQALCSSFSTLIRPLKSRWHEKFDCWLLINLDSVND